MDEVRDVEGPALELDGLFGGPCLNDGVIEWFCGVEASNWEVKTSVSVGIMGGQADAFHLNEEDEKGQNICLYVHLKLI